MTEVKEISKLIDPTLELWEVKELMEECKKNNIDFDTCLDEYIELKKQSYNLYLTKKNDKKNMQIKI